MSPTALDLGSIVARVVLITGEFDGPYTRVVRQFAQLGAEAEASAAGTASLDRGLTAVGGASNTAAAGLSRAEKATVASAAAEEKAAAAATRHAAAVARVAEVMAPLADATAAEQQAALRLTAAQDRLNAVQEGGVATTRQLASAQAGLIGATSRAALAEEKAATSSSRFSGAMAGTLKMAAQLGIAFGVFELVKKAIDITREASKFQAEMLLIQTQAGATSAEVAKMTPAVLSLAGPLATAPEALANSLYHAYSVTKNMGQALDIMKISAEGAKVGHADLEETTNALTASVASGIHGVQNYSQAMGALNAIVGAGDMKMSDLNAAMASGLMVTMKNYGLSLVDVGGALATFGDHNVRGANAATQLRMAVMALAVPARGGEKVLAELGLTSEGSAKELERLGLKTGDLAKDLQTGGLNKAVLDLNDHLKKAGISTAETGTVLTQVFGKRAGIGLQILIGDLPRFELKLKQVAAGAGGFGAAWEATTQTASFAFKKLSVEAQVAGLTLVNKLMPAVTSTASALGTGLPAAIHMLSNILGPLVQLVGGALVGAWRALSVVVGAAGAALTGIGHVLEGHKALVTGVGATVLTMWAVWKGYTIVVAAGRAIGSAMETLAIKAMIARDSMAAAAATSSTMSLAAGVALGVIGIAAGIAAYAWQKHAAAVAASKQQVQDFTTALQEDSGALGDNTAKAVANALQKSGALDAAKAMNISLLDTTQAALGNAGALAKVNAALDAYGIALGQSDPNAPGFDKAMKNWNTLRTAIGGTNKNVNAAVDGFKNVAVATGGATTAIGKTASVTQATAKALQYTVDAAGNLVEGMVAAGGAVAGTTGSMNTQTVASNLLKQSLDALNGVAVTVETTTNSLTDAENTLTDGIVAAKKAGDAGATSLDRSTRAGLKNRENLVALIQAAKDQAQATADQAAKDHTLTQALQIGNGQLKINEGNIRRVAAAQGLNKQQTDTLIKSLGVLSTIKPQTTPKVETGPAKVSIADMQARINAIRQGKVPGLKADSREAQNTIEDLQAKIDALKQKRPPPLDANHQPALARIADMQARIDAIRQNRVPGLIADSREAQNTILDLQAQIDALHGKTITITTINNNAAVAQYGHRAYGGTIQGFAGGGEPSGTVYGPGTSKSDSVPTMLSVGEEVIQQPYAGQYRQLLQAINSGQQDLSRFLAPAGKSLDQRAGVAMPAAATAQPVNIYVQNPFTGEYLLAQVADVAGARVDNALGALATRATYA